MSNISLNDEVQAAVAGWQKMGKLCPQGGPRHQLAVHCTSGCKGTGYVQPPEVKALIEAVTKPCSVPSCICGNTGRSPRDWEEIGEGALEGVLRTWYQTVRTKVDLYIEGLFICKVIGDSAALAAVDKALEQMYGGKDA